MRTRVVLWNRVIPVYLAASLGFLLVGALTSVPLHEASFIIGAVLLGAFIPLVILRYLLRGMLGIQ